MKNYYLVFLLVFAACSNHKKEPLDGVITLDFQQTQSPAPSDIIETTFLKLETNENSLLSNYVSQIESFQDKLIILCGGNNRNVLVFDNSGNFIAQIGKIGEGPGEYIIPMSFSINSHRIAKVSRKIS